MQPGGGALLQVVRIRQTRENISGSNLLLLSQLAFVGKMIDGG